MVASKFLAYLVVGIALVGLSAGADAEDAKPSGGGELAAASQNPIANMISLPFQNNTYFGVTKDDEVANVLNLREAAPTNSSGT